ncbi:MAG TPA: histidinol-phosphate transaminase [Bacteroidales bacterium]|nr:histidinol-phosphate transaminase [Bacteroidales bacterium]
MINLDNLLRKNIKSLKPYSSARDEFQGEASVFLDANENPFNAPYNRYPDPLQQLLKEKIAGIKNVPAGNIFLGNGSDEPIDIVIRAFCEPGENNIVAIDPTYGMYKVAADINNVEYRTVKLSENFELVSTSVFAAIDKNTRLVFLCSPNNPSANYLDVSEMEKIIEGFEGIVVLDEAYIDFSNHVGFLPKLSKYPNLVILQTFSKAWGLAAIRLGMAFASKEIISVFNKIKYPYNINALTQEYALKILNNDEQKNKWVKEILANRKLLVDQLSNISCIKKIFPSDANFVLVKVDDAEGLYKYLIDNKIVVRNRSKIALCAGCIRITVGSKGENEQLCMALKQYSLNPG